MKKLPNFSDLPVVRHGEQDSSPALESTFCPRCGPPPPTQDGRGATRDLWLEEATSSARPRQALCREASTVGFS